MLHFIGAWKLVITTLPVGFSVWHKWEVVIYMTRKLVQFQPHWVSDFWRKWGTLC